MTRRQFAKATVAGAMLPWAASSYASAGTQEGWYDRPMRRAQIAFVEDDPGNYSEAFWLDYFRRLHWARRA